MPHDRKVRAADRNVAEVPSTCALAAGVNDMNSNL